MHFESVVLEDYPVVTAACAETLLCLYGMVRPGHIQRSFLVQETPHFWVFECTQGKKRVGASRPPFLWSLPCATVTGSKVMPKIVQSLRLQPGDGEEPWLLRQWGPSPPFSHTNKRAWGSLLLLRPAVPAQPSAVEQPAEA